MHNPNQEAQGGDRPGPSDIWRTWLITGSRAHPIDRRRLQGKHRGLKQILAEGGQAGVQSRPWKDFSRAMVRQSVSEAMGRLSSEERVVVRLAYFAGFSNSEIAAELGMTARAVQSSLRQGLDHLSSFMERGRRAALGLLLVLCGKRILNWGGTLSSPASSQVIAAAVVLGALATAPTAGAASPAQPAAPTQLMVQPAQAAQVLQAPVAGATSPAKAASPVAPVAVPDSKVPEAPKIAAPAIPLLNLPPTISKLGTKPAVLRKVINDTVA